METKKNTITQYFSKWRGIWVTPEQEFTKGQILEMLKYKYLLR